MLSLLESVCYLYQLQKKAVYIGCDNEKDLLKTAEQILYISSKKTNVDMIREIWVVKEKSNRISHSCTSMGISTKNDY